MSGQPNAVDGVTSIRSATNRKGKRKTEKTRNGNCMLVIVNFMLSNFRYFSGETEKTSQYRDCTAVRNLMCIRGIHTSNTGQIMGHFDCSSETVPWNEPLPASFIFLQLITHGHLITSCSKTPTDNVASFNNPQTNYLSRNFKNKSFSSTDLTYLACISTCLQQIPS